MKNTIQDLNVYLARKQAGVVDTLLESNPILATIPVRAASHGIYNVYAKTTNIDAMDEVDYDAELPDVGISFELGRTRLAKIGGTLEMPYDAAKEMGGYRSYANVRMPRIIQRSGNVHEGRIYYKGFLASALANGNAVSAGGSTADSQYSMVFVRYNADSTVGLYNPNSLSNGKLFETLNLDGGNDTIIEVGGKKCIGRRIAMFMEFGLQLADPDAVSAIVNIQPVQNVTDPEKIDGLPTRKAINDALAAVRANPSDTFIYCHSAIVGYLALKFQLPQRTVTNETTGLRYTLVDWNGIPFVGTYNVSWGKEAVVSIA